MDFIQLITKYNSAPEIPDEELYDLLERTKQDLIVRVKGGISLANTPIGAEVRRRAEQDLFFLARFFTWNTNPAGVDLPVGDNAITKETHKAICEFFVKKDKSKKIAHQDPIKNRLLLYPRGGLKTSIDIVDVVQWILNFPDIRILILTATPDLAVGIVSEAKSHFAIFENPSWMNLFFPEFCVSPEHKEAEGWFTCPIWAARNIERKEPTLRGGGILETKAGGHYEVIKNDDVVSEQNSDNAVQCKKISKKLVRVRKMLTKGAYAGYWDKIGTRYQEYDDYGTELDSFEKNGSFFTKLRPCLEFLEDRKSLTKVLIGRAVQIKPEVERILVAENREISYQNATEEGCDVLLPNLISFNDFLRDYDKDPIDAEGQLNQNPNPPVLDATFTHQMMVNATTKDNKEIPEHGPVTIVWDFAYSTKREADYSTATVVMWDREGKGYLIDVVQHKYNPTDLAAKVADMIRVWLPVSVGVEDSLGVQSLWAPIKDAALKLARETRIPEIFDRACNIQWFKIDRQLDAKNIRIMTLHPEISDGRFRFWHECPLLPEVYKSLERYPRMKHDDLPDSMAYQLLFRQNAANIAYIGDTRSFSYRDRLLNWAKRDLFEPTEPDFMQLQESVPIELPPNGMQSTPPGMEQIFGPGWSA